MLRLISVFFFLAVLAAPASIGWGFVEDVGMPLMAVAAVVLLAMRHRGVRHAATPPVASAAAT